MAKAKKTEVKSCIVLQGVAENAAFPAEWNVIDKRFSEAKNLFDYQLKALENAIKVLWIYYGCCNRDKRKFAEIYSELGSALDIVVKNKSVKVLDEFYQVAGGKYPFFNFANRMSFWMATGSGKTLVIVKLIEVLYRLMKCGLIPEGEILFLTYREDLIKQFMEHIEEYNRARTWHERINLTNLKDFEKARAHVSSKPYGNIEVFYYRSDLISDERKENVLNYKDYLAGKDGGNWYVILDEAHKGDPDDSKRQHIFSILSKNGFLFNFSATFTSLIDIATTVYNFNLAEFVKAGFGKKIMLLQEELKAFKEKEDLNEAAKRKVVLKSLILLAFTKKVCEGIKEKATYHNPLAVFLVNSVNTKDADMYLVFKQIEALAHRIDDSMLSAAKNELANEFRNTEYIVGDGKPDGTLRDFAGSIIEVTKDDILNLVYNAEKPGNIEAIVDKKNNEIALKLDTSDRPFALIRMGDISKWIKEGLKTYKVEEKHITQEGGYFEELNVPASPINILLGSRTFYEGWDSNRPNIINFINIGTNEDAKKFALQAIGRGVRIEPFRGKRKRLWYLQNELDDKLYKEIKNLVKPLESVFVMATNKSAMETILTELELVKKIDEFEEVSLWTNEDELEGKTLLIPVYKNTGRLQIENQKAVPKFEMSEQNYTLLKWYLDLLPEEVFVVKYGATPDIYDRMKRIVGQKSKFIRFDENKNYRDVDLLVQRFMAYVGAKDQDVSAFKPLQDEIVHFRKIKVRIDQKTSFEEGARAVKEYKPLSDEDIFRKSEEEGVTLEQALKKYGRRVNVIDDICLQKLGRHYYIPVVYSESSTVDWIKNIITEPGEVSFLKELVDVMHEIDRCCDWWMFSKLNEHYDVDIYIPYFNSNRGELSKFIPDFVFWLKKGNEYKIVFIDPKATSFVDYEMKVEGYKKLFTVPDASGRLMKKKFTFNGLEVTVSLKFYTTDKVKPGEYEKFWIEKDSLGDFFKAELAGC
ncbi:DEAD/DEAH box helicase family protein [Thermosediminibacter oceani]|uniref:Type III restriction protein res subunit n=1 Tax=Thermosediminibacter oceani (strain ATCC BAA-1034 / DSM 16646 / JW/IW-1228P) TaxID=555079 RepID=D9RY93_THEOJ|nr:DEAD/DEAH box helicase family protein [Thermosediminibacter oceani]ADL08317.1 type III restriction protein res subunit [Thermosediminibacter oceani DSM 16646]